MVGASGWLGREVLRLARARGEAWGSARGPAADLITCPDVRALEAVAQALPVRAVVNCAGATRGSMEELEAANASFARELAEACRRQGWPLVHVGSAAEYGPVTGDAVTEGAPTSPATAYGKSKLTGSDAVAMERQRGLLATIARPFNVIGPGQPTWTPIGEFAAAVSAFGPEGGQLDVRDSTLVRDFVSRRVVAEVLLRLTDVTTPPPVVNICSGRPTSFRDVITAMARGRGLQVSIRDTHPGGLPRVVGDPTLLTDTVGPLPHPDLAELARQVFLLDS